RRHQRVEQRQDDQRRDQQALADHDAGALAGRSDGRGNGGDIGQLSGPEARRRECVDPRAA
ncbi:conserved hypothetical protein, partial [Ricinus communis]